MTKKNKEDWVSGISSAITYLCPISPLLCLEVLAAERTKTLSVWLSAQGL